MRERAGMLIGAGIGACLMYYFDPDRGRRRRSLLRGQTVHAGHKLAAAIDTTARDIQNRTQGTLAALQSVFDDSEPDDEVLVERVRARIGRVTSHPGSIEVGAHNGMVRLSGPVLAGEVDRVIDCAFSVRGVKSIEDRMERHERPDHIPGLQGRTASRAGERPAFLQANWPPAARALGCAAGGLAALYGFGRRGLPSIIAGLAGSLLLARAATNLELRRLTGIGIPRRAIDVQKTVHFDAPLDRVFAVWADFENFPSFMAHVRRVRRLEDGRQGERWRWTVDGLAGTTVDFDAVITRFEPERLIMWRTEPASVVQHSGRVHFDRNPDGSTTVEVKMTYNPVAGALGHTVARLFGADPKHRMDEDLVRMKTYIETGKPPHDAALRGVHAQTNVSPAPAPAQAPAQPSL